jgi:hypothetical protein
VPPGLLPVDYIGRNPTLLSEALPSGLSIRLNCTLSAIVAADVIFLTGIDCGC